MFKEFYLTLYSGKSPNCTNQNPFHVEWSLLKQFSGVEDLMNIFTVLDSLQSSIKCKLRLG